MKDELFNVLTIIFLITMVILFPLQVLAGIGLAVFIMFLLAIIQLNG